MTPRVWARIALGYLIVVAVEIGLWALLAPRSFYDDFPGLGRTWVSVDGPYNEHLVRDVGALNLALGALLIAAFVRLSRDLVVVSAIASLVWGVPHLVYHLFNRDGLESSDLVVSLGGLGFAAIVSGGLFVFARGGHLDRA
jgi:hypothetical protein